MGQLYIDSNRGSKGDPYKIKEKVLEQERKEQERKEQNEIDKNIKLNRELYLQNQKANPDDTI